MNDIDRCTNVYDLLNNPLIPKAVKIDQILGSTRLSGDEKLALLYELHNYDYKLAF